MALPRQTKTFFFRTISIVLAVVPLVWIFLRLDFNVLFQYIPMVAWWTIPVLCALIFVSTFLQGFRWWILLRAMAPDVPFLRVLSYHFIGVFYSVVLPTSASADIVRTVLLAKKIDYSVAWGATFLCRIIGFFVLVLFSLYGFMTIDRSFLPAGFWPTVGVVSLAMGVLAALSFSKLLTSPVRSIAQRFMPRQLYVVMERLRQGVYLYRNRLGALFMLFIVTCCTQATLILMGCITLYGVAGKFFLSEYFAFLPAIELCANAGLTPNGIGVREGLTALFFKYLNIPNEQLGIYVFITLFFAIAVRMTGGIPVLHGLLKQRKRRELSVTSASQESSF